MKTVDCYFDFLCPYCLKGVKDLLDIAGKRDDLKVNWIPCEAHPRPEYSSQHSDVASAAYYIAVENGADPEKFVDRVYDIAFEENRRIDDTAVLTEAAAAAGADAEKTMNALKDGKYLDRIMENNIDVWDKKGCLAVPDYYMDGKSLLSREGRMISREDLEDFIG